MYPEADQKSGTPGGAPLKLCAVRKDQKDSTIWQICVQEVSDTDA